MLKSYEAKKNRKCCNTSGDKNGHRKDCLIQPFLMKPKSTKTMQNEVFCSRRNAIPTSLIKKLLVMKLFAVFMLAFCLQAGAFGYGQKVTLTAKNASLKSVLTELKKQTGYLFFYNDAWLTN